MKQNSSLKSEQLLSSSRNPLPIKKPQNVSDGGSKFLHNADMHIQVRSKLQPRSITTNIFSVVKITGILWLPLHRLPSLQNISHEKCDWGILQARLCSLQIKLHVYCLTKVLTVAEMWE